MSYDDRQITAREVSYRCCRRTYYATRPERGCVCDWTPAPMLTVHTDALGDLLALWRQALADQDEAVLDYLAPLLWERAILAAHAALRKDRP
jgi:hypothetical protein